MLQCLSGGCRLSELQAEELQNSIDQLLALVYSTGQASESAEGQDSCITLCCEQCGGSEKLQTGWLADGTHLCPTCNIELVRVEEQQAPQSRQLAEAERRAFELTQAVLQPHEMALLMNPQLGDAWEGLLAYLADEGLDAVTQQTARLSAGCVGTCVISTGLAYVMRSINAITSLTDIDAITSQLHTFLEQMAGSALYTHYRDSAILQLTETLVVMLRERGKPLVWLNTLTTTLPGNLTPLHLGLMNLSVHLALISGKPASHQKVETTILELLSPDCADPVCHEHVAARNVTVWLQKQLQEGLAFSIVPTDLLPMLEEVPLVRCHNHSHAADCGVW